MQFYSQTPNGFNKPRITFSLQENGRRQALTLAACRAARRGWAFVHGVRLHAYRIRDLGEFARRIAGLHRVLLPPRSKSCRIVSRSIPTMRKSSS